MTDPFVDIERALNGDDAAIDAAQQGNVRIDPDRAARTGIPEVVLARHKHDDDLVATVSRLAQARGRVMVSRLRNHQWALLSALEHDGFEIERHIAAAVAIVARPGNDVAQTGGRIAVISAGASDRAVADEASLTAEEMGVEVFRASDVGVAGLHRLVSPLREIARIGVDCIVVAAGMDGALPSVVAGLVDVPVIGLPVSVGYGHGGNGEAALMTMLQSCAPGITVVNIDNGVGAGSTAALIANRMAAARKAVEPQRPPKK